MERVGTMCVSKTKARMVLSFGTWSNTIMVRGRDGVIMRDYEGIERFCELLTSMPESGRWERRQLISHAAGGLGVEKKLTGLEPTPDRLVRTMFWDETIEDIRSKAIEIVGDKHLLEHV